MANLEGWIVEIHGARTLVGKPDEDLGLSPVFEMQPLLRPAPDGKSLAVDYQVFPVCLFPSVTSLATLTDPLATIEVASLSKIERATLQRGVDAALDFQEETRAAAAGITLAKQMPLAGGLIK